MLDNSLFDKHKHPLEAQSRGNNERTNTSIAWSFSPTLNAALYQPD